MAALNYRVPAASANAGYLTINGKSIYVDRISCASDARLQTVLTAVDQQLGGLMEHGDYIVVIDRVAHGVPHGPGARLPTPECLTHGLLVACG